ncbi:hypothetical protein KUTeg_007380 [Tegillarca granosa]|uniref:SWI/SNF-related matrix-associated actin-dependent regulator of chromatin subfamily A containing DEAD/H box 1 n=1 Tax=Tegillarca granosa TaxID=220873 RepID=A0ABQ9FD41_TEGGR|nr:hypothetical protein KUTeg_007380 [Tegillarca granosa]
MSSLNTLLKYRFVRKSSDKLKKSDSFGSDQDSNSLSNDSFQWKSGDSNTSSKVIPGVDSSQLRTEFSYDSQNSESILAPTKYRQNYQNSTNSISRRMSQEDSEVSSSSESVVHKQWNNDVAEIIPVINIESDSNSPKVVPETPASELQSPGSPLLGKKNKGPQRIIIDDSDDDEDDMCSKESSSCSKESSPWMSKEQGNQLTNGDVPGPFNRRKSKNIPLKDLSDSDEDPMSASESSFYEQLSGEQQQKCNQLRQMFPQYCRTRLASVLKDSDWEVDIAADTLISSGSPVKIVNLKTSPNFGKTKKKRVMRLESSDSEMVSPPRKRVRPLESSESQETEVDSQATEIYSPSQSSVVDDSTKEERIKFLSGAFAGKSRRELYKALDENNWDVERATTILSKAADKDDQNMIDAMDDEGEDYESGDEGANSDDSLEDEGAKSQKEIILSFFEESTLEELMGTPGCSKKKAELIMSCRPFETWERLVEKFMTTKGLSYDVISGCKEIIHVRNVINTLMVKCEKISDEMGSVVAYLTRKAEEMGDDEFDDAIQITKQPKLLNESLTLKPYQMVGLNWLRIMHTQDLNGILADEMGLGKTIQTIAFLAHLLEEGDDGPHVIIVPSSTIENWIRELDTWCPTLNTIVYYGSQEERRSIRQSFLYDDAECNVLLTTYNMATGGVEDRSLFKKFEFHYAVFDEGHMLKNMSSLRYQNLMKINAERRLLLTGTPLQNNLLELMSLLCFVMPNMFIGKTDHLKKMFTMITVLEQLPKKHEEVVYCQMIPDQQEIYNKLVKKFSKELRDHKDQQDYKGGSSMLMQLRKVANHPLLVRHAYDDKTLHKMSKAIAKKDRVVIFSQFTMMMDIMEEFFKMSNYRYIRLDGSTPVVDRQQLIDQFNTDESIFIFMISTRAGGLGINLTSANVAIIHDIDFNPYNDKQAEDRIHRVGQTREVRVIRLVSKGTVEEAMLRCAQEKLKLEKDVTADEDDAENVRDVVSLLKEALGDGNV